jgi:hypothetical protein
MTIDYESARTIMKSGDLVAIRADGSPIDWLIKVATGSDYAHIGIVWRVVDRVFMLESRRLTGVGIRSLSSIPKFDLIPTGVVWTLDVESRAIEDLEKPYSILDAIRLGLRLHPDKSGLVCSLFVADVLGLPRCGATPGQIVNHFTSIGSSVIGIS